MGCTNCRNVPHICTYTSPLTETWISSSYLKICSLNRVAFLQHDASLVTKGLLKAQKELEISGVRWTKKHNYLCSHCSPAPDLQGKHFPASSIAHTNKLSVMWLLRFSPPASQADKHRRHPVLRHWMKVGEEPQAIWVIPFSSTIKQTTTLCLPQQSHQPIKHHPWHKAISPHGCCLLALHGLCSAPAMQHPEVWAPMLEQKVTSQHHFQAARGQKVVQQYVEPQKWFPPESAGISIYICTAYLL